MNFYFKKIFEIHFCIYYNKNWSLMIHKHFLKSPFIERKAFGFSVTWPEFKNRHKVFSVIKSSRSSFVYTFFTDVDLCKRQNYTSLIKVGGDHRERSLFLKKIQLIHSSGIPARSILHMEEVAWNLFFDCLHTSLY